MSNFGEGAGQASGMEGSATWFAETDAGQGARVLVSLNGYRGQGGEAGRPLAPAETPRNLRARRDNRSWVTIEYGVDEDEQAPLTIRLRSPHVVFLPGSGADAVRRQLAATVERAGSFAWPGGQAGARIALLHRDASDALEEVLAVHATGSEAGALLTSEEMLKLPSTPWLFDVTVDLGKAPGAADALLRAIAEDEPLVFRVTTPDGGVVLADTVYTDGVDEALAAARAALDDPAIAGPLTERCAPYVAEPMQVWGEGAAVSPAVRSCDPRTPEQRAHDRTREPAYEPAPPRED